MRRQAEAVLDLNAHHRALRRCHGCGQYARPFGEIEGRLLCERCLERWRAENGDAETGTIVEISDPTIVYEA
jgi:hypothetical protein